MKQTDKNNKTAAKADLPVRIENSFPGKILIFLFDISFIIIRKFLSSFRSKNGNLIIISLHRLGDTVFTVPAIREILNHYKNYSKIIFCYEESGSIYKKIFEDRIIILNKNHFKFGSRIATSGLRKILKTNDPEIIFDLTGAVNSASLIFNSTASQIIGMNDRIFKNIYSKYIRKRKAPHLIDTYLDVADLVIPVERNHEVYLFKYNENKNGKIFIHPFAGWKAKEWNLEKFIQLGKTLNNNYEVVFISKNDAFSNKTRSELKKLNIEVITTQTVDDLIAELGKCSLIISNDSGPVHLASMFGIPTFSIYGPTNPLYSAPSGEHHEFIQKKIECSPLENKQYCLTDAGRSGCPSFDCMNFLTIDEVLQKLYPFLNRIEIKPKIEVADDKSK